MKVLSKSLFLFCNIAESVSPKHENESLAILHSSLDLIVSEKRQFHPMKRHEIGNKDEWFERKRIECQASSAFYLIFFSLHFVKIYGVCSY